ncbi:hypothetical protein C8J56DRAFT_799619 [Mycena floridula]|nr:hypothetical protein C8J56DRAFT_803183 [Mycena floridula]KAJ7577099.1 hypothetical protein C8J56DRAFT_799619 [Mycena floridula]
MLLFIPLCFVSYTLASSLLYDGRAPLTLKNSDLDTSTGPFLTAVKGSQSASHYTQLLGRAVAPTPLRNNLLRQRSVSAEQTISITIDNSSVFVPGGGAPQLGFRRTELIAQGSSGSAALDAVMEVGKSKFHFSIQLDSANPLNLDHEYQPVFIEPSDGSHVFGLQLGPPGSPFTNPTGTLPAPDAHSFKVLDHATNVIFSTDFKPCVWHNFAVEVDWDNRTLQVFYSVDADNLKQVTDVVPNLTTQSGSAGQGDFHFGLLKLPLVNSADSAANQADVVHFGIQEGTKEGLLYSGVFVETA